MTFPKKTPTEIKFVTFDFGPEAASAYPIGNPVITAASLTGDNPTDLTIDVGSIIVSDKKVSVLVGAGLNRMVYRLTCQVDSGNGERHDITKDLPVADDGALVP